MWPFDRGAENEDSREIAPNSNTATRLDFGTTCNCELARSPSDRADWPASACAADDRTRVPGPLWIATRMTPAPGDNKRVVGLTRVRVANARHDPLRDDPLRNTTHCGSQALASRARISCCGTREPESVRRRRGPSRPAQISQRVGQNRPRRLALSPSARSRSRSEGVPGDLRASATKSPSMGTSDAVGPSSPWWNPTRR